MSVQLMEHAAILDLAQFEDPEFYDHLERARRQTVGRINSEFGTETWQPVRLEIGESERKAVASLKNYDVLLVNPVYDGLNLVVKEGALVNTKNGVIVLSENAGAHEELQGHVLSINPFDVEATAAALYVALMMGPVEKKRLNEGAREVVHRHRLRGRQVEGAVERGAIHCKEEPAHGVLQVNPA